MKMKDLVPLAVIGLVAYLMFSGKGGSLMSALSSFNIPSLPAKPFEPGQFVGTYTGPNPLEATLTPEQQIAATREILANQPGNVPEDTQLVFASYDRHWANQLGGQYHYPYTTWNGYRARYVAAYGGEDPSPNLSNIIGNTPVTAGDYLSAINTFRAQSGRASLGGWA